MDDPWTRTRQKATEPRPDPEPEPWTRPGPWKRPDPDPMDQDGRKESPTDETFSICPTHSTRVFRPWTLDPEPWNGLLTATDPTCDP